MKKWMIHLIGLTFALAVIGAATGFTLSGGSDSPAQDPTGGSTHGDPTYDEGLSDFGDGKVVTSIDDIDPDVCNAIHNINACTPEELEELGVALHGDPTYEEWLSDFGDGQVVTSIDDIDPNVCNAIHNINACTPEELEELGVDPAWYTITDVEYSDDGPNREPIVGEIEPGWAVDGVPEPQYTVQSYEEAVEQDCGLVGGTVYVSTDGEIGCVNVHGLEDGGEGETQGQPPVVTPDVLPSAE